MWCCNLFHASILHVHLVALELCKLFMVLLGRPYHILLTIEAIMEIHESSIDATWNLFLTADFATQVVGWLVNSKILLI